MSLSIASNTWRECMRRPFPYLAVATTVMVSAASTSLHLLNFGAGAVEAANLAISAPLLSGLALSAFVGTALVRADLERGTLALLRAQPIGLDSYVLGRFLGLVAALLTCCALTGGGVAAVIALSGAPNGAFSSPLADAWLRVALAVPVLAAVSLAASALASRVFAPVLFVALFLAGDIAPSSLASGLLPSFAAFGLDVARHPPLGWLILYSGLHSVVFLTATYIQLALRPPTRTESL